MTDRDGASLTRRSLMGGATATGFALLASPSLAAIRPGSRRAGRDMFPLIVDALPAAVVVDAGADSAVLHAARSFAEDLERVSGNRASLIEGDVARARGTIVLIGVLGQSAIIEGLAASGRIDAADLRGEWEAFRHMVIDKPFPGVSRAFVIVGSDRRGAVFGTFDVSERIGVSPWHWFADVPVLRQREVYLPSEPRRDQPKVRYRGFFINDEAPCLSEWAKKKFGGANAAMYAHVFELLLRMKGNYLWPAMWAPRAFAADDPQNMILADAMGVVMGNSHHEPMLRAHEEWHRDQEKGVTGGAWDYERNTANLQRFWRGGIERMMSKGNGKGYESVVTIGMRGDGDEAMSEGTAIPLLERIVSDQRAIIAEVTRRPASETPQVWALYKEVQDYYDHGMEVPDDVILLFADDNWGQIRRLPAPGARPRKGGAGVYYHFDYVGGPRNYKWLNTNQIEKVWQQMDLAYRRDARSMWIVNVGDIKPMEYPLGFFLAMAWDPEAMTPDALAAYPRQWAAATFGGEHGLAIGEMITAYSNYAARRKPELIDQDSFAIGGIAVDGLDGGEFGGMVAQWDALEARVLEVRAALRPDQLDAYYQLLEFPVLAMANLYRLYYCVAWNRLLASRNDARANYFADQAEAAFGRDAELTRRYHMINGGKWDGMMAQVHMSYVIWNDPTQQTMPSIMRVGGDTPNGRRNPRPKFVDHPPAAEGLISVAATDFDRAQDGGGLQWTRIPRLGREGGAMVALPQGRSATSAKDGICLEYDVAVRHAGPGALTLHLAPTLDTIGKDGVRVGVSLGEGPVQILQARLEATGGAQDTADKKRWAGAVCDNVVRLSADVGPLHADRHTIKIWRIDDNVVLQKIVLSTDALPALDRVAAAR